MSQLPISIPAGIHLSAVSVGAFELVAGVGKDSGKPYQKVVGRGVAGSKFVKVTQFLNPGEAPLLFGTGDKFEADIVGVDSFEKGREVISLFVELRRPFVADKQEVKK
ncbi:MAG: hypothetical protein WC661_07125 [Opitutaceae bacterium]|jgi:hypothetical protein